MSVEYQFQQNQIYSANSMAPLQQEIPKNSGSVSDTQGSSLSVTYSPHSSEDPLAMEESGASSDDSCMANEMYMEQNVPNPLNELQNSLERTGVLGQSLSDEHNDSGTSSDSLHSMEEFHLRNQDAGILNCHRCHFQASSSEEFSQHMSSHYEYKCPHCDYTSRTEGRLTRHIQDFHSKIPPQSWAGKKKESLSREDVKGASSSSNRKPKTCRCKHCGYVCVDKPDYYNHLEHNHLKKDKILRCEMCCFVTDLKHHFQYHVRNHYGSKPFECNKCNYKCVNQSMLNSHKKSHSKFYPYRCGNCKYVAKYCHSLKLHLKKHGHVAGQIFNPDGTLHPNPVIDVYGRRRGPKAKSQSKKEQKASNIDIKLPMCSTTEASYPGPNQTFNYNPTYFAPNHFPSMVMGPSPIDMHMPSFPVWGRNLPHCSGDFPADSQESIKHHLAAHFAKENSDLVRTYNINPDVFHVQAKHLTFNNYPQNTMHYIDSTPKHERKNVNENQNNGMSRDSIPSDHAHSFYNTQNPYGKVSKPSWNSANVASTSSENKSLLSNSLNSFADNKEHSSMKKDIFSDEISPINHHVEKSSNRKSSPISVISQSSPVHSQTGISDNAFSPKQITPASQDPSPFAINLTKVSSDSSRCSLAEDYTPLDLSGKSVLPSLKENNAVGSPKKGISHNGMPVNLQSKNRRKGKAFKLNQYTQSEDSPSKMEVETISHKDTPPNLVDQVKTDLFNTPQKCSPDYRNEESHSRLFNGSESWSTTDTLRTNDHVDAPTCLTIHKPEAVSPVYFDGSGPPPPKSPNRANTPPILPKIETKQAQSPCSTETPSTYTCQYCAVDFKNCAMYTMHMGHHGFDNPFKCNKCGCECKDSIAFYVHLLRVAHT